MERQYFFKTICKRLINKEKNHRIVCLVFQRKYFLCVLYDIKFQTVYQLNCIYMFLRRDSCIMFPLRSNRPKISLYKHFASSDRVIQLNVCEMMSCAINFTICTQTIRVTHTASGSLEKVPRCLARLSSSAGVKIKRECHLSNVHQCI